MTNRTRLTLHEPRGMAAPPDREAIAVLVLERDIRDLRRALDRIPEEALPRALGESLASRFGRDKGRRIADMAVVHAWES
jgi:hypothetical protein